MLAELVTLMLWCRRCLDGFERPLWGAPPAMALAMTRTL